MDFHVCCECGREIPVAGSAAGTAVDCPCGRKVVVPSLGELRRRAGLPTYRAVAAAVIQDMLVHGELPFPGDVCASCDSPTDEVVVPVAECERTWVRDRDGNAWLIAFLFLGIWADLLRGRDVQVHGENVNVQLPIRVCPLCQGWLFRRWNLWVLGLLKIALAVAGAIVLLVWSLELGALLLVASGLTWWLETTARNRQQAALKAVLRQVPVYDQLLGKYPKANIVVGRGGKRSEAVPG